jgi:hypothetical protein
MLHLVETIYSPFLSLQQTLYGMVSPITLPLLFKIYRCDTGFIPTMDIKMLAGRNFIGKNDASNYIINRKAWKQWD